MPRVVAADARFPPHYVRQAEVAEAFRQAANGRGEATPDRITRFFTNVGVDGRHMVLPLDRYSHLGGFAERSEIWLQHAMDLGAQATSAALEKAGLRPCDVALFASSTVTGVAVPSLESRLIARMGFPSDCRRLPLFGLGCVAGAAGLARVTDFLRAHPADVAILLCVELCSLTFQLSDMSVANIIGSALFGDAAACVVVVGDDHPLATSARGPIVCDTRSVFFPDTERTMGWDIIDTGFRIVLSGSVPDLARGPFSGAMRTFLADHSLTPSAVVHWTGHPGGPAVIDAIEQGLALSPGVLDQSRRSLASVGNLSSASVLTLLADTLHGADPQPQGHGVLFAMGPGFCAELVLLEW